jgi:hypothetical protein
LSSWLCWRACQEEYDWPPIFIAIDLSHDSVQSYLSAMVILDTDHMSVLQGRFITREAILAAVDTYELIESYP